MAFASRELIRGYNKFLFVLFLLSACHVELIFCRNSILRIGIFVFCKNLFCSCVRIFFGL